MRAVIQRVDSASVTVRDKLITSIDKGLLIFLGISQDDGSQQVKYLAQKISRLRIFSDQNGKMNLSIQQTQAKLLVVSQFTLCADFKDSGRRPSFDQAKNPQEAEKLYLEFIQYLKKLQLKVEQGIFREYMKVHIVNDGPVTFVLDTKKE